MRHRPAVRVIELRAHAPSIGAEDRYATRESDGGRIEVRQEPVGIGRVDGRRQCVDHLPEAALVFAQLLDGSRALEAERDMPRDGEREMRLRVLEAMRRVVIGHELADQPPALDERNERERLDPLGKDRLHQGRRDRRRCHVADADRLRVRLVLGPRRVSLHGPPVSLGKAAGRREPHDTGAIEEQHRCAIALQAREKRIHRGVVHLFDAPRTMQPIDQAVQRVLVADARGQRFLGAFAVRDAVTQRRDQLRILSGRGGLGRGQAEERALYRRRPGPFERRGDGPERCVETDAMNAESELVAGHGMRRDEQFVRVVAADPRSDAFAQLFCERRIGAAAARLHHRDARRIGDTLERDEHELRPERREQCGGEVLGDAHRLRADTDGRQRRERQHVAHATLEALRRLDFPLDVGRRGHYDARRCLNSSRNCAGGT
ncbi:MAG TPA: hypothetical protein VJ891_04300 [Casimicrobiaceae bacterium]|nr:hypothetical protein [Casimicrobiaceae bacterium]